MGKYQKTQNPHTCEDDHYYEVCMHRGMCHNKYLSLVTTYWMTFIASGAFVSVSLAAFATVTAAGVTSVWAKAFTIALIQGIAAAAIYARFSRFGGFFNPANLIADAALGKVEGMIAVIHFVVMTVAYVVFPLLLTIFFADADLEAGRIQFAAGVSLGVGFFTELFGSFVLALFGRAPGRDADGALSLWGALTGSIIIAFAKTGGSLNPHLYLGHQISLLISRGDADLFDGSEFVAYVFAPILGFLLAGYLHRALFIVRKTKTTDCEY